MESDTHRDYGEDGKIRLKEVPVGLFSERDAYGNHKLGDAYIRLALTTYRENLEDELKQWLAKEAASQCPSLDEETRERSTECLNSLVKPLVECILKVAEIKQNRRIDYIKWLFTHQMGEGFHYNRGGITGIVIQRPIVVQWLERHSDLSDQETVPDSILIPFLDELEKLVWGFVQYFYVHIRGLGDKFFTHRESYITLISSGRF